MNAVAVYAASVGHAVWFSDDGGDHWARPLTPSGGLYNEARAWSLSVHPERPGEVWAGTDQGLYRWRDRDDRWHYVSSPLDGLHVLKLAQAPHDPSWLVAGTRPAALFISRDDGASWTRTPLPVEAECDFINTPRVTSIQFDPLDRDTLWVTVEIAGIFRSRDGGASWVKLVEGLRDPDAHNLVIFDRGRGREIFASTEAGLHRSDDDGESWRFVDVPAARGLLYFRCMAARADGDGTLFLSIGDRPSGLVGRLLRSRDFGDSWEEVTLDPAPATTIWWIGTHLADSNLLFFVTIFGAVYRSDDGGESWRQLPRVLGELREIAWQPML